jgi:hypothetical protein
VPDLWTSGVLDSQIKVPHVIDWDANSNGEVDDGGSDMYDGGNRISTSLCPDSRLFPYSDDFTVTGSECFGQGATYRMQLRESMMILLSSNQADVDISLHITGNLGTEGFGSKHSFTFHAGSLTAFITSVCDTADATVNHMFIIDHTLSPYAKLETSDSTDIESDVLLNIAPGAQFAYVLYSTEGGHCMSRGDHQNMFLSSIECDGSCKIPADEYICICATLSHACMTPQ